MHRVTPLSGTSSSWSGNLYWTDKGRASRKLWVAEECGAWWGRAPRGDGWRKSQELREPGPAEGRNPSSEGAEPEQGSAGAGSRAEAEMGVQGARQRRRAGGAGGKDRPAESGGTGSGAQRGLCGKDRGRDRVLGRFPASLPTPGGWRSRQGRVAPALPEAAAAPGAPRCAGRGGRLRHLGGWGGPAAL